jgi:hypothetical protein
MLKLWRCAYSLDASRSATRLPGFQRRLGTQLCRRAV